MVDSDCAGPEHCHHSDCSSPSNVSASSHLRTIPIIYSSWKPMADIQDAVMMEMAPSTHAQLNTVLSQVHQCIHTIFANYRCSMRWQIGTVADLHDGIASKADLYVLLASTCSRTTQAEIESALTDSKSESSWNAYCGPKTKTKKVSYLFTPVDLSIAVMSTAVYHTVLAIRTLGHVPCMNSVPVQPVGCSTAQCMDIIRDKPLNMPDYPESSLPARVHWLIPRHSGYLPMGPGE